MAEEMSRGTIYLRKGMQYGVLGVREGQVESTWKRALIKCVHNLESESKSGDKGFTAWNVTI